MIGLKFFHTWLFLLPFKGHNFNYDQPKTWFLHFPRCGGQNQSPIPLYTNKAIQADLPPLEFYNYDTHFSSPLRVHNNGHTVHIDTVTTETGDHPFITGGGLDDEYELESFHFHWGAAECEGSEHAIDGKKYDMEMHILHKNKRFRTVGEAGSHPFGLLVLAILFKAVDHEVNQTALNAVCDILPLLTEYDSKVYMQKILTARSLLSSIDTSDFYTYRGSLTTPPCSEVVTWFVFKKYALIQTDLLQRFRWLRDSRNLPIQKNTRPLQARNFRNVYHRNQV